VLYGESKILVHSVATQIHAALPPAPSCSINKELVFSPQSSFLLFMKALLSASTLIFLFLE